jgi:hypothetical protein
MIITFHDLLKLCDCFLLGIAFNSYDNLIATFDAKGHHTKHTCTINGGGCLAINDLCQANGVS